MTQPFRLQPAMPVNAYKTYAVRSPIQTHTRVATCKEVDCPHWISGWRTTVDTGTPLGAKQATYIKLHSGRTFIAQEMGRVVAFTFGPGQECFREHRVPLAREPIYIVRGGDWRGNPSGERRVHARASDWVDDFAEHQIKIIEQIERG